MKILTVSDVELSYIYSPSIRERFCDADMVISCGDLPYYYLEYIISTLNVTLYYVRGNHASKVEYSDRGQRQYPWGGIDLHQKVTRSDNGLLMAGIEGCLRYNAGPHQYRQSEMWTMVFRLIPGLLFNRIKYGRFLDVFVAHAPPWKIHDQDDLPHQGIKAFNWFIRQFKPSIFLHGHIHIYRQDSITDTILENTHVINSYGHRVITLDTTQIPYQLTNLK